MNNHSQDEAKEQAAKKYGPYVTFIGINFLVHKDSPSCRFGMLAHSAPLKSFDFAGKAASAKPT